MKMKKLVTYTLNDEQHTKIVSLKRLDEFIDGLPEQAENIEVETFIDEEIPCENGVDY